MRSYVMVPVSEGIHREVVLAGFFSFLLLQPCSNGVQKDRQAGGERQSLGGYHPGWKISSPRQRGCI